jgi:uncharacterized protein YecT (DUF1311 family)
MVHQGGPRAGGLRAGVEGGPLLRRLLFLVLVVLVSASPARAADCSDAPNQVAINACAGKAYEKADDELNALYKTIKQRLADAEMTRLFVTSQRAWVPFRDAACKFAASGVSGGTIYPTICAECLERLTKARVAYFKAYLACEEGDLSCPVPAK